MRVVMFYHSLVSDWNHGNAHFLRGVASELIARGHKVSVFEPFNAWSAENLKFTEGHRPFSEFYKAYPNLSSRRYDAATIDFDEALQGADLVLVHEWNEPILIKRLGAHRISCGGYRLLFHDTHHRMISNPEEMARYDLRNYDGVLAFGKIIADLYKARSLAANVWVWHEAADTRIFRPHPRKRKLGDLVWIGNWGDDERSNEIKEFLIDPVKALDLCARIYGVRYPLPALQQLKAAGIEYKGWLANFKAPRIYSAYNFTVHIPRRPYTRAIPGIPTIRVFEALACGIPLLSAPWSDTEHLFKPGRDFLVAKSGAEMKRLMSELRNNRSLRRNLAKSGYQTVLQRHTCSHRVDELLKIYMSLTHNQNTRRELAWLPV